MTVAMNQSEAREIKVKTIIYQGVTWTFRLGYTVFRLVVGSYSPDSLCLRFGWRNRDGQEY
jgi:hypothetical protein